jgi:hypothetical protein
MAGGITGKLSEKAIKAFVSKAEKGKKLASLLQAALPGG